ncbi:MAG: TatD family hydrolase [Gammaproteobacteria bacterium]|nr:TatD family hydrolase [Gammaproteobacteria bacterium]
MEQNIVWADSHCHLDQLDLSPFEGKLEHFFSRASSLGVRYFLDVCIDEGNLNAVCAAAAAYPFVWCSIGIHPNTPLQQEVPLDTLCEWASRPKVVAIGETGLDYYRSEGDLTWQRERFRRHIQAAIIMQKPLIVHSRDANEDTIRILREERAEKVGGVLHCFAGDLAMAQAAMDLGFYISFSGVLTFKNAQSLQDIARTLPLERLLVETDSPYLTPVPHRGKANYPDFVHYVGEKLADLQHLSVEKVAQQTTKNFFQLFRL